MFRLSACVAGLLCYSESHAQKDGFGVLAGFVALTVLAEPSADQAKLATANTGFAFDLLKQIAGEHPNANIFISPFSVSTVLQMVGTAPRAIPGRRCNRF